jgi:hypothetical protein
VAYVPPVGRFEPTGPLDVQGLAHSVAELSWGVLRGARGPSDGTAGAASNVPSALGVLRHSGIYAGVPSEIDEAFGVLETHVMRHDVLYPVAIAVVPILFHTLRKPSPISDRIANLLGRYATLTSSLEAPVAQRMTQILADHSFELVRWLGVHDRALCAIVLNVPALREVFIAAVEGAERVSAEVLLALVELGEAPGDTIELATVMLDGADARNEQRMAAAAFLAKLGGPDASLAARIDAALPPNADTLLRAFVDKLWSPTVIRPIVAPKLYDAEVVFTGKELVIVRAGGKSVTLPWKGAPVAKGERLQVGLSTHGEPKLAVVTDWNGAVRVVDFDPAPTVRFR